jgi:hypothetical protein
MKDFQYPQCVVCGSLDHGGSVKSGPYSGMSIKFCWRKRCSLLEPIYHKFDARLDYMRRVLNQMCTHMDQNGYYCPKTSLKGSVYCLSHSKITGNCPTCGGRDPAEVGT